MNVTDIYIATIRNYKNRVTAVNGCGKEPSKTTRVSQNDLGEHPNAHLCLEIIQSTHRHAMSYTYLCQQWWREEGKAGNVCVLIYPNWAIQKQLGWLKPTSSCHEPLATALAQGLKPYLWLSCLSRAVGGPGRAVAL